jgi:hypothetical protein
LSLPTFEAFALDAELAAFVWFEQVQGAQSGGRLWERFTVHYTPKHGSWLNQAEIEISLFSRQCPGRRRIPSLRQLQRQARAWNRKINRDRGTINWQFTRTNARQKFGYNRNNITRSQT